MQKQPHTEQDRKRQDAISELHRRNREQAVTIARWWGRLGARCRSVVWELVRLEAQCQGEELGRASDAANGTASAETEYLSPAERIACVRAGMEAVLRCRFGEGQEIVVLDRDGRRVVQKSA